ncbi:TPA: hypothetical protein N0F65_008838 [Lagenidium giganteum]|uniref:Uncharacterized protein n=1 Tax=Lagenidium giganteum TaxID=4803 RepID=A0AAV2YP99_9STRA|nr:TPA: hypothetical protein N0F65_008838 [Lagenidium giganteum]
MATAAQEWSTTVRSHGLRFEHVTADKGATKQLLLHLTCELESPIPLEHLVHSDFLCLGGRLGGVWRLRHLDDTRRHVECVAWQATELTADQVNALDSDTKRPLFDWQMQLGVWEDRNHWFLRPLELPENAIVTNADGTAQPLATDVKLLAGFTPLRAHVDVTSITSVETVEQTFAADVTWSVSLRAVTTTSDEAMLHEFLDQLGFDADAFELQNLGDAQSEYDIKSAFSAAGQVHFLNALAPKETTVQDVLHWTLTRRVVGTFHEEMLLHDFPFDRQKITFTLACGRGLPACLTVAPRSIEPGHFDDGNFKLSNVFRVVYGSNIFVGAVDDQGATKSIRFELMLERDGGYHLANVAFPSAIITYLCFLSYAPLASGELMDTGSRLQIVLTLVLTAVAFKNNVAMLLPQVSYFTTLDKYVMMCFLVACVVTIENALFPVMVAWLGSQDLQETAFLGHSIGFFTIVNVVWGMYTLRWLRQRQNLSSRLLLAHEYLRVVSTVLPSNHREVLEGFLCAKGVASGDLPQFLTVPSTGDVFVQLPAGTERSDNSAENNSVQSNMRKQALRDLKALEDWHASLVNAEKASSTASTPPTSSYASSSDTPPCALTIQEVLPASTQAAASC